MNSPFAIGFKFRNRDCTAWVSIHPTETYTFYQVHLNDEELIREFGPYLNFVQDALTSEGIKSIRVLPKELEHGIAEELVRDC